jgi:inorganic pyrophosphatase
VYKELEHKETAVEEFGGPKEAMNVISFCIDNYNKVFK